MKKVATSDFDNLVRNGIDFLEKAMSQLDSEPKYSVINFYTAVEIFLKAPLVHDHWSLVVVDRDPNRRKYEAGDFISVSFDDACNRLDLSLKKPLTKSAKEAFNRVRKHRNRMVHFYHSGTSEKQRDVIKLEQAQAWFELNHFITDDWCEEFKPYMQEFKRMENNLVANNHYAQTKYESLKTKIEGQKSGGAIFKICPKCGTGACQVNTLADHLTTYHCKVCFLSDTQLNVTCPECGDTDQSMSPYEPFECEKCKYRISGEEKIFRFLDQSKTRYSKDDFDSVTPANCDECQGYQTVCEYAEGYLCSNCFTFFNSLSQCDWCSDHMTGSADDTYVNGCEHCEGYADHHADD